MNNDAIKSIQTLIRQEQWTRDTSAFTKNVITQIDEALAPTSDEEKLQLLEACQEHLQNNKDNLCALYVSSIICLQQNAINDMNMMHLIEIMSNAHKWEMVEYLCHKLRSFNSSLNALRELIKVYEATNQKEKLIKTWKTIVQEDFEEADIALQLAEHEKKEGNIAQSINDYKKALNRYLLQKKFMPIKDIWAILIEENPSDINFYFSFVQKTEGVLTSEKTEELLTTLQQILSKKNPNEFDVLIDISKRLLKINPSIELYRKQLVQTYRNKYKDYDKLKDFIRMSNIEQPWRNVHEAISDFEKHISFFPGSFVHHAKWGIGRIKEVSHQYLVIDFAKKRDHSMDISMAVSSLEALSKKHFWVLKSVLPKEKLKQKIITEPLACLKSIIKSFGSADMKTIKNELVPSVLDNNEWKLWSVRAKKYLENHNLFGILPEKPDNYVVSEIPVSKVDKVYNLFKKEEKLVDKVKIVRKALAQNVFLSSESEETTETFWQIFDYFNGELKTAIHNIENKETSYESEAYVHSLFLCHEMAQKVSSVQNRMSENIQSVIQNAELEQLKIMLQTLMIKEYKDKLFASVFEIRDDWRSLFLSLFSHHHTKNIIEILENANEISFLQEMYKHLEDNFQNNRNAFTFFVIANAKKAWLEETKDEFKTAGLLLRACISFERDIYNKHLVPQNKRLIALIEKYLFSEEYIKNLLSSRSLEEVQYLYSLIRPLGEIFPSHVLEIQEIIENTFPDFVFNDLLESQDAATSKNFFTLTDSFNQKQRELQYLHEVEVPENSKEIEKARSYGDLRENAEYKAALEHQITLNNRAAVLQREINKAKIFDFSTAADTSIGFGTKIIFEDLLDNSEKQYIILGPWESEPSKGIISYLAPIGQKLYRKKLDETCEFTINNVNYKIKIKDIEVLSDENLKEAVGATA